jgi:hypothetical protein
MTLFCIRSVVLLTFSALALLLHAGSHAAEKRARLTIDIEVDGEHHWDAGLRGKSDGQVRHRIHLTTVLKSDGELRDFNPLDPDYARQMQARSEEVQRKVQAAQMREHAAAQRGRTSAPAYNQPDMMALAQKAQAECGTDRACLAKFVAQAQAAAMGGDPATQAKLTRYAAQAQQCETQHAGDRKAIAACQNAARVRAGGTADEEENDDSRFLHFFGFDGCGAQVRTVVDDRVAGFMRNDGAGRLEDYPALPFTTTHSGESRGTADETQRICVTPQIVYDTKTRTLTTRGIVLPDLRGTKVRTESGKAQREENAAVRQPAGIDEWIFKQLLQMPASGSATTTLPEPPPAAYLGGKTSGGYKARLSWKFEQL